MINKLLYLILLLPCLNCMAQEPSLEALLNELDRTIERREEIVNAKDQRIESLKQLRRKSQGAARLELTATIIKEYGSFRTDSALAYAREYMKMANSKEYGSVSEKQKAVIELARCYSVYGDYDRAENMLNTLEADILEENKIFYYNSLVLLYVWRLEHARLKDEKDRYYSQVLAMRDSVYKYETDPVLRIQQHSLGMLDEDIVGATEELKVVMPEIKENDEYVRFISNSLASCYKRMERPDSACYYYAMSALADLRCGVQEHASLRELALLLFDKGDVARAYRYTNCCLEDAWACGAQLRMMQMASDMPVIMDSYQRTVNDQKSSLRKAIMMLTGLLVVITCFMVYLFRITRKLHRAQRELTAVNEQLKSNREELERSLAETKLANEHLQQANVIKEKFVAQYMKQCMKSLELLENYRHSVLKLALGGANINKVVTALRDNTMAEKEHREFLENFDEAFLSLFPTFVTEFNNLLVPEERIYLTESKRMNTELRIYALIRLGITESEDIGNFIGKSVKTVYNYRAKMRNRAISNRDNFDQAVQRLC